MDGLVIGGFEVVFLVLCITRLVKTFGLQGSSLTAFAVGLGVVLNGLAIALSQELIPAEVAVWIVLVVRAVGYTLSTPGLFDLVKRDFLPAVGGVNLVLRTHDEGVEISSTDV